MSPSAQQTHRVCLLDDRAIRGEFVVPNDAGGLATLKARIAQLEEDPSQVHVVIEATLMAFISELLEAGFVVYPVNPKTVERARDRFKTAGIKDDRLDARVLADLARTDRAQLRPLVPNSPLTETLRLLSRDHENLTKTRTMLTNQLRAALQSYYPVALDLFDDLDSPTALAFLREFPTLQVARQVSLFRLAEWLRAHRHPKAHEKAVAIYHALRQPHLTVPPAVVEAKTRLVLALVAQLQTLQEHIRGYEAEIERLLKAHPDGELFRSLPGAGVLLAARMLGSLGDRRDRYSDVRAVQALAGTAPVTRQSGKRTVVGFRRACDKPFRAAMTQFAFCSLQHCAWAAEYYRAKRAAGYRHPEALRALANIWLRILFAMWRRRESYDESRFLQARLRIPTAAA